MNDAPARILIVEDERKLAQLLADYLGNAGYQARQVHDGREARAAFEDFRPALVLLDLMLPGRDGLDVCRELRALGDVPIVMVTARVEEIDRLIGLELGADDYICKPFSPREVVARVKAILRRAARAGAPAPAGGGLRLEPERYEAHWQGHALDLTPVEFRLLRALAEQPGRVYSRAHLLARLYEDHRIVTDRTVDSHVKNLRRKLEDAVPGSDPVRSIYGVGYKLEL